MIKKLKTINDTQLLVNLVCALYNHIEQRLFIARVSARNEREKIFLELLEEILTDFDYIVNSMVEDKNGLEN